MSNPTLDKSGRNIHHSHLFIYIFGGFGSIFWGSNLQKGLAKFAEKVTKSKWRLIVSVTI